MNVFSLSKADIVKITDYDEIISVVENGFGEYARGNAVLPPVTNIDIAESNGEVHIKPCHIRGYENYCIKIASGFYDNPKLGLPAGNGIMLLFDSKTGALSALLFDEGLLTDLRTAAAGAIAAKYLANEGSINAGVIGTGCQARMQMEFLAQVRDIRCLYVYGIENVDEYINDMAAILPGVDIEKCNSSTEAVSKSDVLVTTTTARSPVITADGIHPGMLLTTMGSDGPEKQEADTGIFRRLDKIVVDHLGQTSKLGELHHAINDKIVTLENVHAELGEIIIGNKPGRESDNEIILCDLTGVAVQDIAISNWALSKAKSGSLGNVIEIG